MRRLSKELYSALNDYNIVG